MKYEEENPSTSRRGAINDHIIEAAKAAGGTTYTNRHYPDAPACAFGPEALERFYAIAYRQGMERAAEIAEDQQDLAEQEKAEKRFKTAMKDLEAGKSTERNAVDRGEHWMCVSTCNVVLRNAAKAIRAEAHAQNQTEGMTTNG